MAQPCQPVEKRKVDTPLCLFRASELQGSQCNGFISLRERAGQGGPLSPRNILPDEGLFFPPLGGLYFPEIYAGDPGPHDSS